MKGHHFVIIFILIFSSCIPNKKIILLQTHPVNEEVVTDSIVREFPLIEPDYLLQPGDVISIAFYTLTPSDYNFLQGGGEDDSKDPLLSGYVLDKEGNIEIPIIGKVNLLGMTVEMVEIRLKDLLKDYLQNPTVQVKLLSFRITVLGEVNRPGPVINYNKSINLLEALAMSGDLTDYANRKNIKIVRNFNGKTSIVYVNVLDDDFITSPYYFLKPNDMVIVSPLRVKNVRTYQLANYSLLISTLSVLSILFLNLSRR